MAAKKKSQPAKSAKKQTPKTQRNGRNIGGPIGRGLNSMSKPSIGGGKGTGSPKGSSKGTVRSITTAKSYKAKPDTKQTSKNVVKEGKKPMTRKGRGGKCICGPGMRGNVNPSCPVCGWE